MGIKTRKRAVHQTKSTKAVQARIKVAQKISTVIRIKKETKMGRSIKVAAPQQIGMKDFFLICYRQFNFHFNFF